MIPTNAFVLLLKLMSQRVDVLLTGFIVVSRANVFTSPAPWHAPSIINSIKVETAVHANLHRENPNVQRVMRGVNLGNDASRKHA